MIRNYISIKQSNSYNINNLMKLVKYIQIYIISIMFCLRFFFGDDLLDALKKSFNIIKNLYCSIIQYHSVSSRSVLSPTGLKSGVSSTIYSRSLPSQFGLDRLKWVSTV